jgi:RNA polymerase sigma factor (sigma-70 family)
METEPESDAARLFIKELDTIERAIRFVCRRSRMAPDEVDDFSSHVKLKLIDYDYAVIRKYDRRSRFAAYIAVVVQRLLIDYQISHWGKWHASAHARKLGEAAMAIEVMALRDGRSIEEITPAVQRRWPHLARREIEEILCGLPVRHRRPRMVEIELAAGVIGSAAESVGADASMSQRLLIAQRITAIVRATMSEWSAEDQSLFRMRFERHLGVAEISRTLQTNQKPLYRRLQRSLQVLRRRLEDGGITSSEVAEVLNSHDATLDFGFDPNGVSSNRAPGAGEEGA